MDTKMKKIERMYIAMCEGNERRALEGQPARMQIGQSHVGDAVFKQTRYAPTKQQDGPIRALHWTGSLGGHTDHQIHRVLEQDYGRVRDKYNKELFEFPNIATGLREVKEAFNKVVNGLSRKDNYKMRPEQQECCDKVVAHLLGSRASEPFLVAAKTRFGKTFVTYQIIHKWQQSILSGLNILILSAKPDVSEAWKDDANNHCDFSKFGYSRAKDGKPSFDSKEPTIVFESLQQLHNKEGKKKSQWIYNMVWDLVVIDEEHYGTNTLIAEAIKKKLTYKRELNLSGTPFKSLLAGKYSKRNIYSWTLTDEQKKRKLEKELGWVTETYRSLPEMNFHLFKVADEVIEKAKDLGYVGEDGFAIDKVFAAKNGKFENPELVKLFLDSLAQRRKGTNWSPWHSKEIENKETLLDHMLWILPWSVDSVKAMAKMMNEHWFFKDYHILCASGQGKDAITQIREVKEAIKRNSKTITLSCGRFDTGTTVPEWGAVFMMDGGNSPEKYFQSIGRCGSEWADRDPATGDITKYHKENCLVIDFNPLRTLKSLYQWCEILAKPGCDTEDSVKDFLDVASIMEHSANGVVKVDLDDILAVFTLNQRHVRNFTTSKSYALGNLSAEMIAKLNKIPISKARALEKELNLNPELADDETKIKKGKKKGSKPIIDETMKLKERIQTILSRLPTYLFIRKGKEKSISEICATGDRDLFKKVTSFDLCDFKQCVDDGGFDKTHINRQVLDYSRSVRAIKPGAYGHVAELLEDFERMGKEETPGTSERLVKEMLDLREDSWDNPNTKYVDLGCSTGTFLIEMAARLDKGLAQQIPDRQERLKHILEKQLFGYESNKVPYLMAKAAFQVLFGDVGVEPQLVLASPLEFSKRKVKEMKNKFDDCIVVGNPPYQENDGGGTGSSAKPIYHKFMQFAKGLSPSQIIMITPSRWFTGGKGLDSYRAEMLSDKRIKKMIDYPIATECFPGVSIEGGVSYFLWNKDYKGDCEMTTLWNNEIHGPVIRPLAEFPVLIRHSQAASIVRKVNNHKKKEKMMNSQVQSRKPFGIPSFFKDYKKTSFDSSVKIYGFRWEGHIFQDQVTKNKEWISLHKTLLPKARGNEKDGPWQVLGPAKVAGPNEVCTETYLVCGLYKTSTEAENLSIFLKTKFARFLIWVIKMTQNISKGSFSFTPVLDMKTTWTDEMLYKRYNLDDSDINFIEKMIKEMK
jgi:site-specific DNA-methyltransferase (adenine-specific)